MSALLELAERCEAAEGPDREIDEAIMYATQFLIVDNPKGYTASLDAAMTLVPEGMDWFRERGAYVPFIVSVDGPTCRYISECDSSLPLALCAAALKARDEQ